MAATSFSLLEAIFRL